MENSYRDRPYLGPNEYAIVRGLNSASSVDSIWNTLVRAADTGVLRQKRAEDPKNEHKWSLVKEVNGRGSGYNTLYKIDRWIKEELPDLLQLNREQTFKKKEITPDDIMVLLGTLWTQARHIPCTPQTRISFHTAVLMAAIGGFRPGELMLLKYNQVQFELLRDPRDPSKRRLVASIQIRHSKQKRSIQESQHRTLLFCITTIPCKPLCLVSLLVGRALADRAFETDFRSLDDILNRPRLDHADSLPLHWAKHIEDKAIVPICYATYLEIWGRTLTVAGLRDKSQRPYSLRVGAGGRLSGSLTEPVRNYVLGNSEDVFLRSYQPHRVSHNLVEIAFDPKGAAAAESIGEFLQLERLEKSESESVTLDLVSLYVPLLQRRPAEVIALLDLHGSEQKNKMMPPYEPPIDPKRPHRCLFGCDSFSKRGNLTKHNTTCHFNRGDFDQPFSCPECRQLRLREHVINRPMQWSNHIKTCHGREHAPNLPRGLYSRPSASWIKNMPCHQVSLGQEGYYLVCGDRFKNAGAFATHFRIQHVEKQKFFESPFDCPECVRQQTDPSRFDNAIDWQAHLKMDYQGGGIYGKLHILLPPRGKKRLRTEPSNCQNRDELATVRTPRQRLMLTKEDDTSAPAPIIHSPAYTLSRFSPGVDFSLIDPQLLENC